MIIAVPAIVLILLFASSAVAFVVSRFSFWFNVPLLIFFMAANLLPQQVILTPLYELYLRHPAARPGSRTAASLYDSYIGLIAINVAFQTGFCTFVLSNYMKTIPKSLDEAARVDGAGVLRQYFGIILPLCKPALAALATLEFTWIYNDFLWAIVLMSSGDKRPITSSLNNLQGDVLHRQQPDRGGGGARRAADDHRLRRAAAAVHQRAHARGEQGMTPDRVHRRRQRRLHEEPARRHPRASPRCATSRSRCTTSTPTGSRPRRRWRAASRGERGATPDDQRRTLDRRAALDGADFVLNMVQIGGHEATLLDFEIPARYGLRQTIADTLGIGGIFRTLRTADAHARARARDGRALPRTRWLLNYTNPMAALCELVYAGTPTQNVVGLCHSVQYTVARPRGARRRARGRGHVPRRRASTTRRSSSASSATARASTRGSTQRIAGDPGAAAARARRALPAARLLPDRVERARRRVRAVVHAPRRRARALPHPGRRVHPPQRGEPRRVRAGEGARSPRGEAMPLARSNEYAATIINSMVTGEPRVIYGNVRNAGLLAGPAGRRAASRCRASSTAPACSPSPVPDYPRAARRPEPDLRERRRADGARGARGAAGLRPASPRCSTRTRRRR